MSFEIEDAVLELVEVDVEDISPPTTPQNEPQVQIEEDSIYAIITSMTERERDQLRLQINGLLSDTMPESCMGTGKAGIDVGIENIASREGIVIDARTCDAISRETEEYVVGLLVQAIIRASEDEEGTGIEVREEHIT